MTSLISPNTSLYLRSNRQQRPNAPKWPKGPKKGKTGKKGKKDRTGLERPNGLETLFGPWRCTFLTCTHSSTSHLSHIHHTSIAHPPHIQPISTTHRPHIHHPSSSHPPYIDPTSTSQFQSSFCQAPVSNPWNILLKNLQITIETGEQCSWTIMHMCLKTVHLYYIDIVVL